MNSILTMKVEQESDLYNVSNDDDITLAADIYITDNFTTIDQFSGILEGNSHTIYNLNQTFITKICESATIKNVNFKNVQFEQSRGIFTENHGEVKSVSVVDFTRNGTRTESDVDREKRSIGGVIGFNTGSIQDCSLTNFSIAGSDFIGGIVGFSDGGDIISCTVDGSSKQNNFRVLAMGVTPCGGICSVAENNVSISNCTVHNVSLIKNSSTFGGIVGKADSVIVKDSTVSDIELKSRGYDDFGGIVVDMTGSDSIVKDCTVHNIVIDGLSRILLIGSMSDGSSMKNCYAENVTAKATLISTLKISLSDCGVVKECFGRNITVKSRNIEIKSGDVVTNCMLDIYLSASVNSISVNSSDSKNSFISVNQAKLSSSNSVTVSSKSEFNSSMRNSIITLVDDIDMDGEKIPIEIFTGELHGNGYTIYNFEGLLFDLIEDAKIENVHIKGTQVTAGVLSKKVEGSTLNDVVIEIKDAEKESGNIAPVEEVISYSTVRDCTIFINTNTTQKGVFGLAHKLTKSTVIDCDFTTLVQNNPAYGYGISAVIYKSKIKDCNCLGRIQGNSIGGVCNEVIAGELMNINCDISLQLNSSLSVGGICNILKSDSTIEKCTFSGSIQFQSDKISGSYGGLTGIINGGRISNCVNKGSIDVSSDKVGGIAGKLKNGVIEKCVNRGSIKGNDYVGGVIGMSGDNPSETKNNTFYKKNNPKIRKSGNEATVSGNNGVGGIIGSVSNSTVQNCYNYGHVTGKTNRSLSIGLHRDSLAMTTIKNILVKNIDNESVEIGSVTDNSLQETLVLLGV